MDNEHNTIVEWRIENFSFWRLELHEKCFSSPELSLFSDDIFKVELYPRGLSGNDEYLVVNIIEADLSCSGDLSFIGSDGSIICIQQVDYDDDTQLPPGPKYVDVYSQIKKNEASHKDRLTLRFQVRHQEEDYFEHLIMSTTIDVQIVSLKIDQELIENIEPSSEPELIFRNKALSLKTAIKGENVEFKLEPRLLENQCFLVETIISMISSAGVIMRKEEQRHLFSEDYETPWTFSNSLNIKLFSERGIAGILHLVIIQRDMVEDFSTKIYKEKKVPSVPKSSSDFDPYTTKDSVAVLTRELMCLYQDQEFTDFTLKCGAVSFPVHKNILSARSPVFKRLLSSDMKEATSGCMDIVDLDTSTLARFLTFIYTGKVEDLEGESALKLYYAADKYQVLSLKKECSDHLCANVSVSNVCDILALADRHQDQDLGAVSRDFVLDHFNEVMRSREWAGLVEGEPSLAAKIVTSFAAKDCVVKKGDLE